MSSTKIRDFSCRGNMDARGSQASLVLMHKFSMSSGGLSQYDGGRIELHIVIRSHYFWRILETTCTAEMRNLIRMRCRLPANLIFYTKSYPTSFFSKLGNFSSLVDKFTVKLSSQGNFLIDKGGERFNNAWINLSH